MLFSISKRMFAVLLAASLVILTADVSSYAAVPLPQTVLKPAAPRKMQFPRIVIYTVSWCPHCRELKEHLTSRNIPYINRDVELDSTHMDELVTKYKSTGVPVVVIGNDQEVLKGFTVEAFEKALAKVRSGKNLK